MRPERRKAGGKKLKTIVKGFPNAEILFCFDFKSAKNYRSTRFALHLTLAVWFVADFEAIPYQDTVNFDKS